MSAIVSLEKVSKSYVRGKQEVLVLHDLDLNIEAGDFAALMGPSGSGKTTLLNLIGGLDQPTSGSITVAGQKLETLSAKALAKWRAQNIGFVFQFYNLLPVLTAQRNVELPLLLTSLNAFPTKEECRDGAADRRARGPREPQAGRALRRPTATRRDCARARGRPDAADLRRTHRRPRPRHGG